MRRIRHLQPEKRVKKKRATESEREPEKRGKKKRASKREGKGAWKESEKEESNWEYDWKVENEGMNSVLQ